PDCMLPYSAHLSYLDLAHNNLEEMPTSLQVLSELAVLRVSYNKLLRLPTALLPGTHGSLSSHVLSSHDDSSAAAATAATSSAAAPRPRQRHNLLRLLSPPLPAAVPRHPLLVLDLAFNCLAELDHGISRLTSLHVLDLSYNPLTSLPSTFSVLGRLRSLSLRGNLLRSFPPSLTALSRLSYLDVAAQMTLRQEPGRGVGLVGRREEQRLATSCLQDQSLTWAPWEEPHTAPLPSGSSTALALSGDVGEGDDEQAEGAQYTGAAGYSEALQQALGVMASTTTSPAKPPRSGGGAVGSVAPAGGTWSELLGALRYGLQHPAAARRPDRVEGNGADRDGGGGGYGRASARGSGLLSVTAGDEDGGEAVRAHGRSGGDNGESRKGEIGPALRSCGPCSLPAELATLPCLKVVVA
ncbi:hypothetical protein VaNZ11_005144, partial [Volvox africanus]